MIHPSYVDLMQVVNKGVEEGETPVINSRYSIVMATAKRARQIVDGDEPLIDVSEGVFWPKMNPMKKRRQRRLRKRTSSWKRTLRKIIPKEMRSPNEDPFCFVRV